MAYVSDRTFFHIKDSISFSFFYQPSLLATLPWEYRPYVIFVRTSVLSKPPADILQVRLSRVIIKAYVSMASKGCWNWNLTVLT